VVLVLALGIGMATAMFTVFRAVVLPDLPVQDSGRIITLATYRDPTVKLGLTLQQLDGLRLATRTLQDAAGAVHFGAQGIPVTEGDRPLLLKQAMVTANFFDVLGARPVLGRLLRSEDGYEGAAPVAVISYKAWQGEFSGDEGVIGRRLTTTQNLESYEIVGVAPPGMDYPIGTDYWTRPRPFDVVNVVARLLPNVAPPAAQSEFLSIVQVLDRERRVPVHPTGAMVETLTEAVLGNARPVLIALTAAVTLLLLIVCVNVGNLLLLRSAHREREIVIRRALGASSSQVARLVLLESALLGLAGGVLGLASALGLLRVLLAVAPAQLPRMDLIGVAGAPVGVAIGITLLVLALFGVLPALAALQGDKRLSSLRLDSRSGTATRKNRRVRQLLVASQVALAVVLLAGAGLLVRSLQHLERLELGYDTDRLSIVELAIPFVNYDSRPKLNAMFDELHHRLRAVPGVTALTPVLYRPFIGANLMQATPTIEGQSESDAAANSPVPLEAGGPEYFRTFEIPILRGRGFVEADRENAPKVVVVSEAVAERYWPGRDPIGKRLRLPGDGTEWRTVLGVAGDIRFRRLREPTPTIYLPWRQAITFGILAVRTQDELGTVLPAMRRTVRDFEPRINVWVAGTMDDYLAEPLAQPRLSAFLLSGFGLVALLLGAIGLYGLMASAVRERTRDIGVRLALGATPERLRREVLVGALAVTTAGGVVGLCGALVSTRLLGALLFEVRPTDPATLVGVCIVLLAVSLTAAYLPARRATRIDPAQALRAE
jgi:predicted permease